MNGGTLDTGPVVGGMTGRKTADLPEPGGASLRSCQQYTARIENARGVGSNRTGVRSWRRFGAGERPQPPHRSGIQARSGVRMGQYSGGLRHAESPHAAIRAKDMRRVERQTVDRHGGNHSHPTSRSR